MYVLSFINLPIFNLGTNALLHPGPIILLSKYNTHNLHHVENSATVDLNTFLYVRQIHKNNNSIWLHFEKIKKIARWLVGD